MWYGKSGSSPSYRMDFVHDKDAIICEIFLISHGVCFFNASIHADNEVDLVFRAIDHLVNKLGPREIMIDF